MKTTFILGLPRCGSLALSNILNNTNCIAHHEGYDFNIDPTEGEWLDTYAGERWQAAYLDNKSFVSCDISSNPELIYLFLKYSHYNSDLKDVETPTIIIIKTSPHHCIDSIVKLTGDSEVKDAVGLLHTLAAETLSLAATMEVRHKWKVLGIDKHENTNPQQFTRSQMMEIALTTGALNQYSQHELKRIEYLRKCHFSVSSPLLRESMSKIKKN